MPALTHARRAPSPELDDITLIRAQRGDALACRALVGRYEHAVFAVVSRMVGRGDDSLVEDLSQETFLRTFRNLPNFNRDGDAKLSTWILTVATRLCIDELRKRRTRPAGDPSLLDEVPDGGAHQGTESLPLRRNLEQAVAALPEDFRAAFVLRAYHEWSHEEIADALRCEVGTVKSRIARAKAQLQAVMKEERHD